MAQDSKDLEQLKVFTGMQQSEAKLHGDRNSYYLVVSSLLLLALSQFEGRTIQILIGCLGTILNFAWLLIQYRSSKYIEYWKAKANEMTATKAPDVYSKDVGGIEMRKVEMVLPIVFLAMWIAVTALAYLGELILVKKG